MKRLFAYILIGYFLVIQVPTHLSADNSRALYEQGVEAYKSGNFGSAGLIFRKIVDTNDEFHDRAWYHLGLSIFRQKKYESAIFEFNRFLLDCATSDLCALSRFWIAESEYYRMKYIKAIEEYNRFIAQSPDEKYTFDAMRRIGDIYFIQSRYDEAVLVWNKTLDKAPDEDRKNRLVLKIGESLFLNEQYDESLELLDRLKGLRGDPKTAAKANLLLGRVNQLKNNYRMALRYFNSIPEPMLKEKPYYDAQYFKSLSYKDLGQKSTAKSNLEVFLIIGKDSEWYNDARHDLGKMYIQENMETKGIRLLEEARNNTTKMELRSMAAMELAKIYMKKNPLEAIPYLEDSVSLNDPEEQKNALLLLSRVYVEAERNADAERLLELMVNKYPYDNAMEEVQFLLSRVHLSRGQIDKAVEGFNKIREINPFSKYIPETNYYLGLSSYQEKNPEKAVEYLKTYLGGRNPEKHFQANVKLHDIYLEIEDYNNADRIMKSMMRRYRRTSGFDDVVYRTGLIYREKEKKYDDLFNFVVVNSPRSGIAGKVLIILGDEAFRRKDYAASERSYRTFLSVQGRENASSVYLYRIISLYQMGHYRDVLNVVADEPIPPADDFTIRMVHFWEGKSYFKAGNSSRAYERLKDYDLDSFSDDDLFMMVRISLQSKDAESAESAAGRLMRNPELHVDALFDLGMFYKSEGDRDRAETHFSDIVRKLPEGEKGAQARLELAEMMISRERYNDAISELLSVESGKHDVRKNGLLVSAYFAIGDAGRAVEITEKNKADFSKSSYGEKVFRENLLHYYGQGDSSGFKRSAGFLKRYSGTGSMITYYTGMLEYNEGSYKNAYYNLYKLTSSANEYRPEALYRLGLVSLYEQENPVRAMSFFSRLAGESGGDSVYAMKAKLHLALDAHQKGDTERSKEYLTELLGSASERTILDQALNLYEHFGFYEDKKK